jgi:DNA-binding transcriptional ArsR family regulator
MELDVVLTGARGASWSAAFHQEFNDLIELLPQGWLSDWDEMLGRPSEMLSLLDKLAYLAGVLGEEDYQAATLAMRKLSTLEILERLTDLAAPYGMHPDPQLDQTERLIDLGVRLFGSLFPSLGLQYTDAPRYEHSEVSNFTHLAKICRDGELHDRFWMWLDRLYFEAYQPWRQGRMDLMAQTETQAVLSLGDKQKSSAAPDIEWLPAQNPLCTQPTLAKAVENGQFGVFFWVEPFGIADMWSLLPNTLVVSIATPGAIYERYGKNVALLTRRVQALADPTRLGILRIIRHFGMINTEIARAMAIQRPTVSIHARLLREAGLITSRKVGREMRHEIVPGALQGLFHELEDILDLPDEGDDDKS